MSPRWPKKSDNFHFWWVLDAFFGFSMRTRHLPSLFYRFWHAFHQVFLKALRKTLARTSREPAKNLASTYDYCRTPSFKTGGGGAPPLGGVQYNFVFFRRLLSQNCSTARVYLKIFKRSSNHLGRTLE